MPQILLVDNGQLNIKGLSRLDPGDGAAGAEVKVGGVSISGSEDVTVYFRGNSIADTKASAGKFGEPGVDVFSVRTANPIDLEIYSQWDESTSTRFPSIDHATWNNSYIQLYDGRTPVESDNLDSNKTYKIRAKITNDSSFTTRNRKVTVKWALYGAGQDSQVWPDIGDAVTLNVPPGRDYAEITGWKPPSKGHVCI